MHDILVNYTFENSKHWESLKQAINLIINAFRQYELDNHNFKTKLQPIEGEISVQTQYQYFTSKDGKTTRKQDVEITEETGNLKYIEFQNRASASLHLDTRSAEYFGLGIGYSKGKPADQLWLLAEDADLLLNGKAFSRYTLKDDSTGQAHPNNSGILYISLTRLSEQATPAGELALFLLGKLKEPKDETVKEIANTFKVSFDAFKEDKEVAQMLSLQERYELEGMVKGMAEGRVIGRAEGKAEGWTEGRTEGANRVIELIESGTPPREALRIATEEARMETHMQDFND